MRYELLSDFWQNLSYVSDFFSLKNNMIYINNTDLYIIIQSKMFYNK